MSSSLRIDASRANTAKSRGPTTVAGRLKSLANSAKSTGAVTPEGQARSSQNAFPQNGESVRPYRRNAEAPGSTSGRHGFLAESIVLDSESAERFSDVLTTLQEELQPVTSIESRYVETMALAEWRRLRLLCLEKEQLTIETRRQEAADLTNLTNNDDAATEVSPIRYTALALRAMSDESRAQELLNRYESRYDRQYQRAMNGLRAYRADRKKNEREARRSHKAKNGKSAKGKHPVLHENRKSENAKRSEPNIG